MNEYTASNTATVQRFTESLEVKLARSETWLEPWTVKALREFFRAEEDERLERWRWPENPVYVVYEHLDGVTVLREDTGEAGDPLTRLAVERYPNSLFATVAKAYFDAHPEPKPWHAAIPGQAWVVEWNNGDEAFTDALLVADFAEEGRVFADAEERVTLPLTDRQITSARRIWPEEDS